MGDRPKVEKSPPPEAALDLLGLAAQMGVALSRVPLKRPWQGPLNAAENVVASVTREVVRSFMGYSTGLRIEEFRSIEVVLDRLSSVAMPPASDIFLAGDSGGGGLVCSLMYLMDHFEAQDLAGVILFSPEVDLVLDQPSVSDNARNDILPWNIPTSAYLHGDGDHTFVSPLSQDVSEWPPTYVVYGAGEMFRDPIRQFVNHLETADVDVEALEAPGMFHVYPILMPWAPPSHEAFNALEEFVKRP